MTISKLKKDYKNSSQDIDLLFFYNIGTIPALNFSTTQFANCHATKE
jgi:hypothetical protein